uniref:Uncharacterized protein n=1 Tax=Cacopsylla melanoneura TaxID=428564 RepID=A0A8D8XH66_9HEMI
MTQPLARDRYQRTSMCRTRPFGEHENLFYPFHLQRVQGLLERDFEPRLQFCRWALVQLATVLNFLSSVLFTDEANFNRDGITNFHNNHAHLGDRKTPMEWCKKKPPTNIFF